MAIHPNPEDRTPTPVSDVSSIADLIGGLIGDAQMLVRREIDLAKSEVFGEIDKAKQAAISLGIGAVIAVIGAIYLLNTVVYALHEGLGWAMWTSYLVVGLIFAIIGGILLVLGINRLKTISPMPTETINSVKKDVQWIQEQSQ